LFSPWLLVSFRKRKKILLALFLHQCTTKNYFLYTVKTPHPNIMPYVRRRRNARRKPRTNRRRARRRPKAQVKRMAVVAGETKLQKSIYDEITHGILNKNEAATLICPYALDQTNSSPPTEITFPSTWNNLLPNTQFYHNAFVSQGTAFNQRVGRRISALSASVELQFGFVHAHATEADRQYPFYASLRVIHGWCKEGVQQLQEALTDIEHIYSEVPWSKYKVLSDKTYTRASKAPVTYGKLAADGGAVLPSYEQSVYAPFKIKRTWNPKDQKITFTDSLSNVTYSGWTPFLMILNPQHGTGTDHLQLEFKFIKRVFAFKDA
jgi:hypothetical protein